MSWLRSIACCCLTIVALTLPLSATSAQVIECPGTLPAADLSQEQTTEVAGKLLGRFAAALNLHGLEALDEQSILDGYHDHPEQLLTKLTYLTLQCQMVLLDGTMTTTARAQAVRRVFLDYVLHPADPSAGSLAAYVNTVATDGRAGVDQAGIDGEIQRIETLISQSARHQWGEQWFLDPQPEADGSLPRRWSVIIASPRYEDDGWRALRGYQTRWPDVQFELDGPFDLESPHYAIVVGRGLAEGTASQLLQRIKEKGLPEDSYIWRAPTPSDDSSS